MSAPLNGVPHDNGGKAGAPALDRDVELVASMGFLHDSGGGRSAGSQSRVHGSASTGSPPRQRGEGARVSTATPPSTWLQRGPPTTAGGKITQGQQQAALGLCASTGSPHDSGGKDPGGVGSYQPHPGQASTGSPRQQGEGRVAGRRLLRRVPGFNGVPPRQQGEGCSAASVVRASRSLQRGPPTTAGGRLGRGPHLGVPIAASTGSPHDSRGKAMTLADAWTSSSPSFNGVPPRQQGEGGQPRTAAPNAHKGLQRGPPTTAGGRSQPYPVRPT